VKSFSILVSLIILIIFASCKKQQSPPGGGTQALQQRKVIYELYSKEDLSNNAEIIHFTLHMETLSQSIFDSLLAPMKLSDIPDSAHSIVIEKSVPGNDTSTLKVGFLYTIDNVGTSWHYEAFPGSDTLKIVNYAFQ
jgi:hypothetical protein